MALGSRQLELVTEAARQCAQAVKRITITRIKSALKKAVLLSPPEQAMMHVVAAAFKASVLPRISKVNGRAIQDVQAGYQHMLEAWEASPSEKHRREMLRLFTRLYRNTPTRHTARPALQQKAVRS